MKTSQINLSLSSSTAQISPWPVSVCSASRLLWRAFTCHAALSLSLAFPYPPQVDIWLVTCDIQNVLFREEYSNKMEMQEALDIEGLQLTF